ncbi:hypothetical protein [Stenotrophomonas sp. BIGb0135]|uniref:hypothetical protein n=1 Tax=Stenotrophomonas sp. BIGb0135 TaxID=2940620 RepID=UPI002168AEA8|nr:hypothetical protein [Stenotrophomonas sp. BIGb0135]MCS4234435.1 hypothetical protein [Stenotrophomonas sp. BIGb0135]
MKMWNVEVSHVAVVLADNEIEAAEVARRFTREIVSDSDEAHCVVTHEVKAISDFRDGWDGACLPYGGDGNTRINELNQALRSEGDAA